MAEAEPPHGSGVGSYRIAARFGISPATVRARLRAADELGHSPGRVADAGRRRRSGPRRQQVPREVGAEPEHRADREVDVAGDDHQRLAFHEAL